MSELNGLSSSTEVKSTRLPLWLRWTAMAAGVPAFLAVGAVVFANVTVTSFNAGDPLSAAAVNANFNALAGAINSLQTTVATQQQTITDLQTSNTALTSEIAALQNADPDCPSGYTKDPSATDIVLCKKGVDEVVKIGAGATAFWADRYEASVWDAATGTGTQYGASADDYPNTFPDTGKWTAPLYAVSKVAVRPSAFLTWFQASEACRAGGKRLPSGSEWLAAAMGTPDLATLCSKTGAGTGTDTGASPQCMSRWGAQDMIGNLWEWTDEWYPGVGDATSTPGGAWPAGYGGGTANVSSKVYGNSGATAGLPAATLRGGSWRDPWSGVLALLLDSAPSRTQPSFGLRCVIPRR
ncbi:MAG: SUMF1/EgtB/PvdO family nonheme iron enzyme [Deltaproteobacteria bacterium]|nr:SUMF1/EgtB/PvdO family nonheme iron enzyme [Deltaproteobacteria bacterium]